MPPTAVTRKPLAAHTLGAAHTCGRPQGEKRLRSARAGVGWTHWCELSGRAHETAGRASGGVLAINTGWTQDAHGLVDSGRTAWSSLQRAGWEDWG